MGPKVSAHPAHAERRSREDPPVQQIHPRSRALALTTPDHRTTVIGILISAVIAAALLQPVPAPSLTSLRLLIHEATPSSHVAEELVESLGGEVTHPLPLIEGFAATVPEDRLPILVRDPSVAEVSVDGRVQMASVATDAWDDLEPNLAWRKAIRLGQVPDGIDGSGVTVALIDTGVARVTDLGNRVVARVDFTPGGNGEDAYGHGTHLAG